MSTAVANLLVNSVLNELSETELETIKTTMNNFLTNELTLDVGMDFKVWQWSKFELYGLLIGTFVNLELIRTSKQLSAFLDFIIDVDKGYFDNPYHSFLHAIDVEYMLYFVLIDLKIKNILKFNLIEISALLIAALTHDILHPGLNNLFQVNAKTEIAELYNNISVLENHSCTYLDLLLEKHDILNILNLEEDKLVNEDCNYFDTKGNHVDAQTYQKSVMREAILNTDMCFHFSLLDHVVNLVDLHIFEAIKNKRHNERVNRLETLHSSFSSTHSPVSFPSPTMTRKESVISNTLLLSKSPSNEFVKKANANMKAFTFSPCFSTTVETPSENPNDDSKQSLTSNTQLTEIYPLQTTVDDRRKFINILLHAADISNAARPFEICKKWSDMIVDEFFLQGDQEKRLNLPITPSMDRLTTNQIRISIQFNDLIARPFFECLGDFLVPMECYVDILALNKIEWEALAAASGSEIASSPVVSGIVCKDVKEEEEEGEEASPVEKSVVGDPKTNIVPPNTATTILPVNADLIADNEERRSTARTSPSIVRGVSMDTPPVAKKRIQNTSSPSMDQHRFPDTPNKGRRLSVAAGTIEIPEKFQNWVAPCHLNPTQSANKNTNRKPLVVCRNRSNTTMESPLKPTSIIPLEDEEAIRSNDELRFPAVSDNTVDSLDQSKKKLQSLSLSKDGKD